MLSNGFIYEIIKSKTKLPLCLCKLISEYYLSEINKKIVNVFLVNKFNYKFSCYSDNKFPLLIQKNKNFKKELFNDEIKRNLFFINYEIKKLTEYIKIMNNERPIYISKLNDILKLLICHLILLIKIDKENKINNKSNKYFSKLISDNIEIEKKINREINIYFVGDESLKYFYLYIENNENRIIEVYKYRNIILFDENYDDKKTFKNLIIYYGLKNDENIYLYEENKYYK